MIDHPGDDTNDKFECVVKSITPANDTGAAKVSITYMVSGDDTMTLHAFTNAIDVGATKVFRKKLKVAKKKNITDIGSLKMVNKRTVVVEYPGGPNFICVISD